jgi:hypothetical protein
LNRLEDGWRAVLGGCELIGQGFDREAVIGLNRFRRWLIKDAIGSGDAETALRSIKAIAKWCDYYAAFDITLPRPKVPTSTIGWHPDTELLGLEWARGSLGIQAAVERSWSGRPTENAARILAQFAKIRRALPEQIGEDVVSSLSDHYNRWTTPIKTEPVIAKAMYEYGRKYGKKFGRKVKSVHTSLSTSASLLTSRREGGRLISVIRQTKEWLGESVDLIINDEKEQIPRGQIPVDWINQMRDEALYSPMNIKYSIRRPGEFSDGPPSQDREIQYGDLLTGVWDWRNEPHSVAACIMAWAESKVYNEYILVSGRTPDYILGGIPLFRGTTEGVVCSYTKPFVARAVTVGENGLKTRIITTEQDYSVVVGHVVRDVLYRMIESDPITTSHDHGELWHLVHRTKKGTRSIGALSADLTAATDTFSHEYVHALYDGLCESHPDGAFLNRMKGVAVGPRTVVYSGSKEPVSRNVCMDLLNSRPDESGHGICYWGEEMYISAPHVTGIAMGNPTSYSLLTVWSRFTLDLAAYLTAKRKSLDDWLKRPVVPKPGSFRSGKIQGDDIIAFGNKRLYLNYTEIAERMGTVPSDGANLYSNNTAVFCERTAYRQNFGDEWKDLDLIKVRPLVSKIGTRFRPGETRRSDPLLQLGSSQRQQIKPWTEDDVKSAALWVSRKSRPRYDDEIHRRPKDFLTHWNVGGLGHLSHQSWTYQWRRFYSPVQKDVWWVLRSDNATLQGIVDARLLMGLGFVPKKTEQLSSDALRDELQAFWTTERDEDGVPLPQSLGLTPENEIWRMIRKYRPDDETFGPLTSWLESLDDEKDFDEARKKGARWIRTRLFGQSFVSLSDLISRINDVRGYNETWRRPVPRMAPVITLKHYDKNRKRAFREAEERLRRQADAMRRNGMSRPVPNSEWQVVSDIAKRGFGMWVPANHPALTELEGDRLRLDFLSPDKGL